MRADAHYVDQLVAPPGRRSADDEPRSPALAKIASAPMQTRGDSSMLNEHELAQSLGAVLSCTDLLSDGMPRLTRTVAIDMIRAETQRMICALRTSHLLKHGVPQERRLVTPRVIIERVAETVAPEARLRGSQVTVVSDAPDSSKIRVDESCLATALASVVVMISAGLHDVQGARLDLKVANGTAGRVTFAVAQESVILPDSWLKVASGAVGEISNTPETAPLVALRQVAEAYAGSLSVSRLPHGTQVAVELPTDSVRV